MEGLSIDKNEILRYLGYSGQILDESFNELICECINEVGQIIKPRYVYKFFNILKKDDALFLEGCILSFKSRDLNMHLEESKSCALLAVTLGNEIDTRIRYHVKADMTRAVVIDACATAAVETVCDRVCEIIEDNIKSQGKVLTSRFSPGYGDLPLNIQHDFICVLGADKSIGLTASTDNILIPRKSVTAVVGLVDESFTHVSRECSNCSKFSECIYRRRNGGCGH